MFTYRDAEGTQEAKPLALEVNGDTVYIRKHIQRQTRQTEQGTIKVWTYKEAILTVADYMANAVAIANNLDAAEQAEDATDIYAEILLAQADIAIAQQQQDDVLSEILLNVI